MIRLYYTYLWLREDGTPYYVGKGTWKENKFVNQERAYRKGAPPTERIILQIHPTEEEAFFAERFLISFYGRINNSTGCLRNYTDGGEGVCGYVPSEDVIRRRAESLSAVKKGKPIPHYDPKIHSEKMMGSRNYWWGKKRVFSEEWCKRLSLGKMGHFVSEETKQKMKAAAKQRWEKVPRKIQCPKGHPYTEDNIYLQQGKYYRCLICKRASDVIRASENRKKIKEAQCHYSA